MPRDSRDSLATEIEAVVALARPDVEVIDVTFLPHQGIVRVLVDHPDGVDHALCQAVTELLPGVRERYGVEVSSPGLERPLKKPSHYRRAEGQTVKVRLPGAARRPEELPEAGW
jgi:ribosome maturation factor RimP